MIKEKMKLKKDEAEVEVEVGDNKKIKQDEV